MASLWQRIGSFVYSAFIMNSTWMRLTKKLDEQLKIDQQDIFHGMSLFLSTVMFFLFFRVFGPLYAPLRPIMAKRGGSAGSCFSGWRSSEDPFGITGARGSLS